MGSTGSGRFSDYPGGSSRTGPAGESGNGAGADDKCNRAFAANLQDVEHCEYFRRTSSVPTNGTMVRIEHRKRIVAVSDSGESIGNLPTTYNYLAECIAGGFAYTGVVTVSYAEPSVLVTIDVARES